MPEAAKYPTRHHVALSIEGEYAAFACPLSILPDRVSATVTGLGSDGFDIVLARDTPSVTSVAWMTVRRG